MNMQSHRKCYTEKVLREKRNLNKFILEIVQIMLKSAKHFSNGGEKAR